MNKLIRRYLKDMKSITNYYNFLISKTKKKDLVGLTNEYLIDNYYLLLETKIINKKISEKDYFLIKNIITKQNYDLDFNYLKETLKSIEQTDNRIFTYQELINIFSSILIICIEKLNTICMEEKKKLINKDKVEKIINNNKDLKIDSFISKDFDISDRGYIFEIITQTKEIFIKELNKYLESKNISIREIIDEYINKTIDDNILIANIFNTLNEIKEYSEDFIREFFDNKEELREEFNKENNKYLKKIEKYKNYEYEKEILEDNIKISNKVDTKPLLSVISNKEYSLKTDNRGNSLDNNIFMFIKDLKSNNIFSNTYAPINKEPDKYRVISSSNKIKFLRQDKDIITKTEIIVPRDHSVEIRKITFKNTSKKDRLLELTSYVELPKYITDKGYIKTEFDSKTNSLIAENKINGKTTNYMISRLLIDKPEDKYSYETEKEQSLDSKLSNYSGDNLNPILVLRNKILLSKDSQDVVYLIVGYGKSKKQITDIINNYSSKEAIKNIFKESSLVNIIDNKLSDIKEEDMKNFDLMINYLIQSNNIFYSKDREKILKRNVLSKSNLWKFNLSGENPVIKIEIEDIESLDFIYEILKAFEYMKKKLIFVDIIIIDKTNNIELINKVVSDRIYYMDKINGFSKDSGVIKLLDNNDLSIEEKNLFDTISVMDFIIDKNITLKELLEGYKNNNKINNYEELLLEENLNKSKPKLDFDNSFGGFTNSECEYVIYNKNTPSKWSNVIRNDNLKSIITNRGTISTSFCNDKYFKISSNINDQISEGFKFNGYEFIPEKCTHGFGYSILESETKDLMREIVEFISIDDNVKAYLMKIKNKKKKKVNVDIEFWAKLLLGNSNDTNRYLITDFIKKDNYLKVKNAYSADYGDINVIMASSEKIEDVEYNSSIKKIKTTISLEKEEEKTIVFTLGTVYLEENLNLINKYQDSEKVKKELKKVKEKWNTLVDSISVKTPDKSFNYMINGWLLYQSINTLCDSINYKEQLQNAMNISMIMPDLTRKIIINCASHQFIEGDSLHFWNETTHTGLRSNYKDDHLWLVYATITYINKTKDYKILEEEVPYIDGEDLSVYDKNKEITFYYLENKETIMKHLLRALDLSINDLGPNKLPLIGSGDFIETMDQIGVKGKGESIPLGFFLYSTIDKFIKMMNEYNPDFNCDKFLKFNEKLKENIEDNSWDESHYIRAIFDNGDKLGSNKNSEGRIDLLTQSMALLSNIVSKDRTNKIIDSIENNLVDQENKLIKLFDKGFSKSLNVVGTIMNYPQGIKENGGAYSIVAAYYIMALIKLGYKDMAYNYFQMINPINREIKDYMIEPYFISDSIYTHKRFLKRGSLSWDTAVASYFYKIGIEDILGLRRRGNFLEINPNLPTDWKKVEIIYTHLDTKYNIVIKKGLKESIEIDGKIKKSFKVNLVNDKKEHKIIINIK